MQRLSYTKVNVKDRSTHLHETDQVDPSTSQSLWPWLQEGHLPRNTDTDRG